MGSALQQHLANVSQRAAGGVAHLEQLLALAEFGQDVDDIVLNFGIAQSDVAVKMLVDQVGEQLLQRVRFRDHGLFTCLLRLQPAQSLDVMRVLIALSSSSASVSCASRY